MKQVWPQFPDPSGASGRRSARPGFTLLELMIAALLMSVLLVATWSLLGTFRHQFERSQQRTERCQIMRSLRQRLEEDLRACLVGEINQSRPDPAAGPTDPLGGTSGTSGTTESVESVESAFGTQSSLDSPIGPAPPFDMALDDPLADSTETVVRDLTAEISQQLWFRPGVGLRGNAQGLVIDVLKPLEPPTAADGELADDQQADIPDIVRRVVYVFTDEITAQRQGRPAGLLRCEWTDRELLTLHSAGGGSDLFDLLRSLVPDWPEVETDEQMATFGPSSSTSRPADLSPQLQTEFELLGREVSQRVDLLPEITAFRLRFFDGGGWQDRWDSQQQKSLPVAVELRFEVAPIEPAEEDANEIDPVTGEPLQSAESPLLEEEPAQQLVEPLDPSLMSAQSQMLQQQDERVVLFLHPPQESSPLAEPSELNDFESSAGFDEGPP